MTDSSRELRADCARCCGLCCVGPAFDSAQGFAYDKPAHRPCRHLDDTNRCSIHAAREAHGFIGCAGFDCFGAGQWVTRQLLGGGSWRERSADPTAVFDAFHRFRLLHEMLAAIELARIRLAGDPDGLTVLMRRVEDACREEERAAGSVPLSALRAEVFAGLRAQVPQNVCSTRSSSAGGSSKPAPSGRSS